MTREWKERRRKRESGKERVWIPDGPHVCHPDCLGLALFYFQLDHVTVSECFPAGTDGLKLNSCDSRSTQRSHSRGRRGGARRLRPLHRPIKATITYTMLTSSSLRQLRITVGLNLSKTAVFFLLLNFQKYRCSIKCLCCSTNPRKYIFNHLKSRWEDRRNTLCLVLPITNTISCWRNLLNNPFIEY